MDKQQRKAAVRQWKQVERAKLVSTMPITPDKLHELLDYLDANLKDCDHTRKLTKMFLQAQSLDRDRVLPWLADCGGFCDCEVLANLTDLDESLHAPPPDRARWDQA